MSRLRFALALALLALPAVAQAQGEGVTPDGKRGRIHRVVVGDTLWGITDTYLGTPWIWPSIWQENTGIANPHRIFPGDLIWIAEGEMRKLSREEAEALLRGAAAQAPAAPARGAATLEGETGQPVAEDPFAALDEDQDARRRIVRFSGLEHAPFVSAEELEASGVILGNHDEHYWVAQEQTAILSLGEGSVHPGEAFSVFRVRSRVQHPETGEPVGYFVEVIGKTEVLEVHPETSIAKIVISTAEIEPGDRIVPWQSTPSEFTVAEPSGDVNGTVVALGPHRLYSGDQDLVILDRGADDGLSSGHELVVFRAGQLVRDPLSDARVLEPDDILGRLFVLKTGPHTAVALVGRSRAEIEPGDRFRAP
jgi:hypothetical protein